VSTKNHCLIGIKPVGWFLISICTVYPLENGAFYVINSSLCRGKKHIILTAMWVDVIEVETLVITMIWPNLMEKYGCFTEVFATILHTYIPYWLQLCHKQLRVELSSCRSLFAPNLQNLISGYWRTTWEA